MLKPVRGQLTLSSGRIKLGEVYLSGIPSLRGEQVSITSLLHL